MWLIIALALATPATYGVMWTKGQWAAATAERKLAAAEAKAVQAFERGKKEGEELARARASAAAAVEAAKTAEALRQAEEETVVPADKAAVIALCKQRASCKERGALK